MDQRIKEKWIEALLSGEYEQGNDYLHNPADNTYCCLGVLCELALEQNVIDKEPCLVPNFPLCSQYGLSVLVPPQSVKDWAGIKGNYDVLSSDPELVAILTQTMTSLDSDSVSQIEHLIEECRGEKLSLIELNDRGIPFEAIADIIERLF